MSWTRLLRPTWPRLATFVVFLVVGVLFTRFQCADQVGPAGQHIGAYLLATLVTWRPDSSRGKGAV